jgi:hypothetical protein
MPRIELQIDSNWNQIGTADYEMAGQWLGDMLRMYGPGINAATMIRLRVDPFFIPDPRGAEYQWVPDWNADSRYMDAFHIGQAGSASDAARKLSDKLYEFSEKLREQEKAK